MFFAGIRNNRQRSMARMEHVSEQHEEEQLKHGHRDPHRSSSRMDLLQQRPCLLFGVGHKISMGILVFAGNLHRNNSQDSISHMPLPLPAISANPFLITGLID